MKNAFSVTFLKAFLGIPTDFEGFPWNSMTLRREGGQVLNIFFSDLLKISELFSKWFT